MKALTDLVPGERAEVRLVRGRGAMRRRLLDLGFVPGTAVELEVTAPFGGLRAYRLRSSVFVVLHNPCSTTLLTIKRETGSWKWTAVALVRPDLFTDVALLHPLTNLHTYAQHVAVQHINRLPLPRLV